MMKILFLYVNPNDLPVPLNLDEEARRIDQALRLSDSGRSFEIAQHRAVRTSDIQDLLLRHKPDIIHFSGHGVGEGGLVFQGENGNSRVVSSEALADLVRILKDNVRCVILNACFSVKQAEHIVEHIDYVVGMKSEIFDETSITFSRSFYQALGYERDIEKAFELGRNQLTLDNIDGDQVPRLFVRAEGPIPAGIRQDLINLILSLRLEKSLGTSGFKELYQACWKNAATLPAAYTAQIVVQNLSDRPREEDGWHPLLELAERMARNPSCMQHAGKLTSWVDRVTEGSLSLYLDRSVVEKHRGVLNEEVRQQLNRENNDPHIFVIVMSHQDNVNNSSQNYKYDLNVIFQDAQEHEEIWYSGDRGWFTVAQIYPALKRIFRDRVVPQEACMEFFVPIELLSMEIDRWPDWKDEFVLFGTRCPVTVRFVERLTDRERFEICHHRWPTDNSFFEHEEFYFLAQNSTECNARKLYNKLRSGKYTSVGVTLGISEIQKPLDLFRALLAVGIPIAVWSRYEGQLCNNSKTKVVELVSQVQPQALPKETLNLRLNADEEDLSHPGNHLILLLDDPRRVPKKLHASFYEPQPSTITQGI